MSEPLHDRVVTAIGEQYDLESEVGRGGMSVVYRAHDKRLRRPVAIKVLPPELAYDPAIRTRFTREAQTSAQLSHAHIVPIFDVGEREGIAYFVMSLITGGNLGELLAREPRQPIHEVRRLLCEIADALAYAHLRGVIHRDIKPDNILLDRESGRAIVTDFGIARAMEGGTRLTITGNAVGTPTYMSPEQAMGEREVDGRSDLYSLGVLGYQMLTGRVPFTAGNSMALLLKHVGEEPRPITELRPDVPRGLREAVERALRKSPEDRWPSAAAFRDALNSEEQPGASWRADHREPVRYASPRPDGPRNEAPSREPSRNDPRPVSPRRGSAVAEVRPPRAVVPATPQKKTPKEIVLEPEHLAGLTEEQRADLRLWHGRVNLIDRIKVYRRYAWSILPVAIGSIGGVALGVEEGIPPFVLAPIVPLYMMAKTLRRGRSLRDSGLRLRRVLLMPRWRMVIPPPPPAPTDKQLTKLATPEILESPYGAAIRRAAADRAAILDIFTHLPKPDRNLLPDLQPTVNALVERVANLAQMIHRLEQSLDTQGLSEIEARIAELEHGTDTPENQRRLSLLKRQRSTLGELVARRDTLARQLESAGLALANLRLDLIKLRSSGIQTALNDVSTATQEARALSREIGVVLDAAAEVRKL